MDDETLYRLMHENHSLRDNAAFLREGVVTDDSPLAVALGGAAVSYESVTRLATYTPTIGDRVSCLTKGNSLLVLGEKV